MSYVIHIWQHPQGEPLPTDIHSTSQWHEQLRRVSGQPSPLFNILASRLREIFADDPAEEDDSDFDPDSVWLEEPPRASKDQVWALGLNSGQLHRSMPVIVREANALGLLVFDFQAGSAYLPTGSILGQKIDWQAQARASSVPQTDDDMKQFESKSELVAVFVEMMEPILKPHGYKFVKSKRGFVKAYPQVEHHLSFDMLDYYPNYEISMHAIVYAKLKPCEFTTKASGYPLLLGGGGHLSSLFGLAPDGATAPSWKTPKTWEHDNYLFKASNAAQLRAHLLPIARYYEEVVIPVFASCTDFKELYKYVSSDDPKRRIVRRRTDLQLYVAHLAQSPDVAKLAEIIVTPVDALACAEDYVDQERLQREVKEEFNPEVKVLQRVVDTALAVIEQHPYPWR